MTSPAKQVPCAFIDLPFFLSYGRDKNLRSFSLAGQAASALSAFLPAKSGAQLRRVNAMIRRCPTSSIDAARKPPLTAKLARIIRTRDGVELRTRRDAATYMTGLPEQRARCNAWQHAARLLLDGAEAEQLTMQIEYALMLDGHRP